MTPFDLSGIVRGADGVARYEGRPDSLVALLRASVDRSSETPALPHDGGAALTYASLWDAAARVAGGLRARGVQRGDRVAIRLPNGIDWVLAFFGTLMAGAVAVPVNTRFKTPRRPTSSRTREAASSSRPASRCPTARRRPPRTWGPTTSRRSSTRAAPRASPRAR